MDKVSKWKYKGEDFTEDMIPQGAIGFIYLITLVDGRENGEPDLRYIGKKNFFSDVKTKLGKKEQPTDKRLKTYKRVRRMVYQNYISSNDYIKDYVKKGGRVERVILEIAYSKLQLTYLECKYQFKYEVLEHDFYLNSNILGKFYKQNK